MKSKMCKFYIKFWEYAGGSIWGICILASIYVFLKAVPDFTFANSVLITGPIAMGLVLGIWHKECLCVNDE